MADHPHPYNLNLSFQFPISHFYPLMASKPLNPNADPFLSQPIPPPPPPLPTPLHVGGSLLSAYGTLYYPRAAAPYFWQFHTYPTVSCYNAWPQRMWPPCPAAAGFLGGGAVMYPKHGFKRDLLVSGGPRREMKSPPLWVEKKISSGGACGGDHDGGDDTVKKIGGCATDGSGITTLMIKNIPNQFK